jgi:hypothetical protein
MTDVMCRDPRRREEVRRSQQLRGLDFVEVSADQRKLTVYLLGKAPPQLGKDHVLIDGGRRIRNLRVLRVATTVSDDPERDDTLEIVVDRAGDFSTYTIRMVERDAQGQVHPHSAFDPRYNNLDFTFKVDCPSDLDCQVEQQCPPVTRAEPEINYLAKDYASFRQLILDRLALTIPEWTERHVPDLGIALVEVLAYVGDYLSYYQDAVATEAYLDTARQRISVRRHARLVDYQMHEGCNARTWVVVEVDGEPSPLDPHQIFFTTSLIAVLRTTSSLLTQETLNTVSASAYEVFEPMTDGPIHLYQSHNEIHFYTWGDEECCLDRGATTATLFGQLVMDDYRSASAPHQPSPQPQGTQKLSENPQHQVIASAAKQSLPEKEIASSLTAPRNDNIPLTSQKDIPKLYLQVGDVLIFEEVMGPKTGARADADPLHRHAVRLTHVEGAVDLLNGTPIVNIAWAAEDALPFPLCISSLGPPPDCAILHNVSVARGNVILVDHGQKTKKQLDPVLPKTTIKACEGEGRLADTASVPERYHPTLPHAPLTFREPLGENIPASRTLTQDVRRALPQVWLTSDPAPSDDARWSAHRDLLDSHGEDQHFVAEIDDDGRAHLRFGDGELGRAPDAGLQFHAVYRIGNGSSGNVGAEAITHVVNPVLRGGIVGVRNPLLAVGGTAPEPLAEVKLFAPQAFRRELQRAVIADDYAAITKREFSGTVQRAAATLRWNGSWYEALVAVDQVGTQEAEAGLRDAITQRLYRYRRIGHDMEVKSARLVPLDVGMTVCVQPHYLRGHVKAALLALFNSRTLADGRQGFFHPDKLSFGDGIYLSKIVAAAQAVTGVESVQVTKLERLDEGDNGEIEDGVLSLGPLEVAQLASDPSFPEHGKFTLTLGGGR